MRLFEKLLLFNLLGKGFFLLIFLMSGPYVLRYFILKNTDQQLVEEKEKVISIIQKEGMENFISEENPDIGFGSYNILKEEYILLEKIPEAYANDSISIQERIIEEDEISYRVFAHTFEYEGEFYLLEIGRSLNTIEQIESIFFRISIGILFLFLAFSVFLDMTISKRIMNPFNKIIKTKIAQINEPQEFNDLPIPSNTEEFMILDQAISEMMKRIQKSFNQERIFISHASHELKTPISVLQSKLEAMFSAENLSQIQSEKLMDMQHTLQKMKKSVNALLLISKVNNAQFLKTENVELSQMLTELLEDWAEISQSKGVELVLLENQSFVFENTNESLCHMMIQNAISNAVKYVSKGGRITLSGMAHPDFYEIRIENEGEGIDQNLIDQVKNGLVFLKEVDKEKSGFGLQIMFKIAIFLGVQLDINSLKGKTLVSFRFPK